MKYTFEIYISGNQLTVENWAKFYVSFNSFAGMAAKMRLAVDVTDNIVRYFVQTDKDIGALSNNLEGMVLREVTADKLVAPSVVTRDRFMSFVSGGNLLDFKEKQSVKSGKDLQLVIMDIWAISAHNAFVKAKLYFKRADGSLSYAHKTMTMFPAHLLAVDFRSDSTRYLKKKMDKYLDIEKSLHLFTSDSNQSLFKVMGFPYLNGTII